MSKDMGDGKRIQRILCDSGNTMGAEWKGVVGIQWDRGEMWGHPGRGELERVYLALAVGRDYIGSAGEEAVMSRSVSQGTLLLCGGQNCSSCRSFQLSTPCDSGPTFPQHALEMASENRIRALPLALVSSGPFCSPHDLFCEGSPQIVPFWLRFPVSTTDPQEFQQQLWVSKMSKVMETRDEFYMGLYFFSSW